MGVEGIGLLLGGPVDSSRFQSRFKGRTRIQNPAANVYPPCLCTRYATPAIAINLSARRVKARVEYCFHFNRTRGAGGKICWAAYLTQDELKFCRWRQQVPLISPTNSGCSIDKHCVWRLLHPPRRWSGSIPAKHKASWAANENQERSNMVDGLKGGMFSLTRGLLDGLRKVPRRWCHQWCHQWCHLIRWYEGITKLISTQTLMRVQIPLDFINGLQPEFSESCKRVILNQK